MAVKKSKFTHGPAMLIVKCAQKEGNGDLYRALMVLEDGGPVGRRSVGRMLSTHFNIQSHVALHVHHTQRHFRYFGVNRKIHLPAVAGNKNNIVLSDNMQLACEAACKNTGTTPAHVYYTDLGDLDTNSASKAAKRITWYYIDYDGRASFDLLPGAMRELAYERAAILAQHPACESSQDDEDEDEDTDTRPPKVARPKPARPTPVYDRLIATLVGLSFRERPETMTIAEGRAAHELIVAEAQEFVKSQLPVFAHIGSDNLYVGNYFLHHLKAYLLADKQDPFIDYANQNIDLWEDFVFHVRFSEPRLPKLGDLHVASKAIQAQTLELHIGDLLEQDADTGEDD